MNPWPTICSLISHKLRPVSGSYDSEDDPASFRKPLRPSKYLPFVSFIPWLSGLAKRIIETLYKIRDRQDNYQSVLKNLFHFENQNIP